MSDEAQFYVVVEDLNRNSKKMTLIFARDEKEAKVKTYDEFGRNIKIIEIRKTSLHC